MTDQQAWDLGTVKIQELLTNLPAGVLSALSELLSCYYQTKETLAATAAGVDSNSICRQCGGECCLNGKYRINVLDYLAHVVSETTISVDFSQKPLCPYGTLAGCTIELGLRPADCVLFLCDAIDGKLSPESRMIVADQEQTLREVITKASRLTGEAMKTPLLIWAGKATLNKH